MINCQSYQIQRYGILIGNEPIIKDLLNKINIIGQNKVTS